MPIIVRSQKHQRQGLKCSGLLLVPMLFLTACGETPQDLVNTPKHSISVSTSPAVSIAPCEQIPAGRLLSASLFESSGDRYSLIGVEPLENATRGIPKEFLETIGKEATCIKNDPGVPDTHSIYLFDSKDALLNASIIQNGYGKTAVKGTYIYKSLFQKLEEEAQAKKRGLWANSEQTATSTTSEIKAPTGEIDVSVAKNYVGYPITFSFTAGSVGKSDLGMYLNTMNDYQHPDNIAILIPLQGDDRMRMLRNLGESLQKRKVKVSGVIALKDGKMVLTLTKGKDLLILE